MVIFIYLGEIYVTPMKNQHEFKTSKESHTYMGDVGEKKEGGNNVIILYIQNILN